MLKLALRYIAEPIVLLIFLNVLGLNDNLYALIALSLVSVSSLMLYCRAIYICKVYATERRLSLTAAYEDLLARYKRTGGPGLDWGIRGGYVNSKISSQIPTAFGTALTFLKWGIRSVSKNF